MQKLIIDIRRKIENRSARTYWDRGVRDFAVDMFNEYLERKSLGLWDPRIRIGKITEEDLLNGAKNWSQYSRDGNYLIYDSDICKALCGPREQKRTKTGTLPPNDREDWMGAATGSGHLNGRSKQEDKMIKTGIIRRVDDLGRIAIPKDIRRQLEIKEGQPMEVGIDNEGRVVLQKYIPEVESN